MPGRHGPVAHLPWDGPTSQGGVAVTTNKSLNDDELRTALSHIAEWGAPAEIPALDDGWQPAADVVPMPVRPRRWARPVWWASAAALIIAIAVVARMVGTDSESTPIASGRWTAMADAPIPPRANPASVWTGTEVIVAGGQPVEGSALDDAAAYNPATNSWRRLPDAPRPINPAATALWTGRLFVIVDTEPLSVTERGGLSL